MVYNNKQLTNSSDLNTYINHLDFFNTTRSYFELTKATLIDAERYFLEGTNFVQHQLINRTNVDQKIYTDFEAELKGNKLSDQDDYLNHPIIDQVNSLEIKGDFRRDFTCHIINVLNAKYPAVITRL